MNKYFKSCVERYKAAFPEKEARIYIHPMSEVDTRIHEKMKDILAKSNCDSGLLAILDDYKYREDQEIEDSLTEWANSHSKKVKDIASEIASAITKAKVTPADFIELNGEIIKLKDIYGVKSVDLHEYDERLGIYIDSFGILLNPLPEIDLSTVPLYANYKLSFPFEEDRDEVYEYIKTNIKSNYNVTKFDKNENTD